ncbi:hypothetical protein P3T24_001651 [Paraburkholderia sp. GAS33]|jgi:hypothetical protein|uniref:hypothetical protein n=1 Tax=Paraburkholderia sp. GAS33 TaxID=3035130 RepID=UPI003D22A04C
MAKETSSKRWFYKRLLSSLKNAPADQATVEFAERFVTVRTMFKANTQAADVMKPGTCALDVVRSALIGISKKIDHEANFSWQDASKID